MKAKSVVFCAIFFVIMKFNAKAHNPTWTDGIACIIYSHCTSCHNQNGIAPFSLLTYNDVYLNRFSIAASVQARSMPPFPASQEKQRYAHANTLDQHEIDDIVDWVNNFAPLGDANNIPAPPTYSSGHQLQNPDFIGQIPAYTVNSNNDVYRVFVLPVNNSQQQTIQSIEVYPGNRQLVHHALVFQDTSSVPYNMDLSDPLPGYSAFGGTGSNSSKLLTVYTPGQGAFNFAPGFGATMLPNTYIIIQIHYPGGVSGQVDSTSVRIKYGPSNLRNVSTAAYLNHNTTLINGPLFILANTVDTFYAQVTNNINRTLTGIMPHMHLIGTSIQAYFVTPANDTVHLIDIPRWDFHWQYFYQFQKPILIPAGSIVYGRAIYDNTSNNPYNPNNPPVDVTRGEGTEDEMFLIYMNLSAYQQGDTNIVIDTSSHYGHVVSCFQASHLNSVNSLNIDIFPTPTTGIINVIGTAEKYCATIYNNEGKHVMTKNCDAQIPLDVQELPAGVFYLQIKSGEKVVFKKIIRQ